MKNVISMTFIVMLVTFFCCACGISANPAPAAEPTAPAVTTETEVLFFDGFVGLPQELVSTYDESGTLTKTEKTEFHENGNISALITAEYDADGNVLGDFSAKDMVLMGTYSFDFTDRWTGGVSGKFIYSNYEQVYSLALGVDLGLNYYNSGHMLSLSVVARNLGGQVKTFDGMHEPLPFNLLVGISKDFAHAPVRLSFTLTDLHKWQAEDFYNSGDDAWGDILLKHFILGVDIFPTRNTYLSVGYNFLLHSELKNHARRSLEGFSVGAGLQVRSIKIGVSYGKYHVAASSLMMNFALTL